MGVTTSGLQEGKYFDTGYYRVSLDSNHLPY